MSGLDGVARAGGMALPIAASALVAGSALAAPGAVAPNPWWSRYVAESQAIRLPDGRSLNLLCEGRGSPTVILESGQGSGAEAWRDVQPALARTTRVCAYDRSGVGRSPAGAAPRDSLHVAMDLEAMLKAADIAPPYVLVGHSTGALHVRMFAERNPTSVVGMVLVEPSVEHQDRRLLAKAPSARPLDAASTQWTRRCSDMAANGQLQPGAPMFRTCAPTAPDDVPPEIAARVLVYQLAGIRAAARENDALQASYAQLDAARREYGTMPLMVLTAGTPLKMPIPEAETTAAWAEWNAMHAELAALSSKGSRRVVEGAGHAIPREKPQAVVEAVEAVLTAARAR